MKILRLVFFVFVRVLVLFLLGLNVRRRELLPKDGPAIVAANHNSHLDTLVLISLFPLKLLPKIRPVAAADYFMKNKCRSWFSTNIIGIIPVQRGKASKAYDPLEGCAEALARGEILILFPEGSRGEPEQLSEFKKGVAYLSERFPAAPVTPVFIHGLGKALPKDDFVLIPFFCDVFVGEPLPPQPDKAAYMAALKASFEKLSHEEHFAEWA